MNNNVTLVVPQWFIDTVRLAQRDWVPFVGTILLALVVIAVTAFVKGRVNVKKEEAAAKRVVIKTTALTSIVLGAIASVGYFITENMPVLKNIPYVGTYMGTVLGLVWAIYQGGIKFKSIEQKAANWATPAVTPTTVTSETATATAPTEAPAGAFLGQE